MSYSVEEIQLKEVSFIRTGYTFRSKIEPYGSNPDITVLQPKDIVDGELSASPILVEQEQIQSIENHLLAVGDVLLANKGVKFSSYLHLKPNIPTIASSSFFVIQPDPIKILPEYLSWFLGQKRAKEYLITNVSGSTIPSLTKKVLEALPIPIPNLTKQESIIKMVQLVKKEKKELELLISKRQEYCNSYSWELINGQ